MGLKSFFPLLLAVLVLSGFSAPDVSALSCRQTFPVIGIASGGVPKESDMEIALDKSHVFDEAGFNINGFYSVDGYEKIAKEYVKNGYRLSQKSFSESGGVRKILIPAKALGAVQLRGGDIIINGPPFHVCSFSFFGIFDKDGKLLSAVIKDNYRDYSYRGSRLEVEIGKELECGGPRNYTCSMEVNFKLGGRSNLLSPGQSFKPASGAIKSISLVDSSDLKKRDDGVSMHDWGIGTFVTYTLGFTDAAPRPVSTTTPAIVPPLPSEPQPSPVPDLPAKTLEPTPSTVFEPQPSPVPDLPAKTLEPAPLPVYKEPRLNFFRKVWRWFASRITVTGLEFLSQ